ncbi:MAG: iron-containing alcohol dehydrogenase [Planctomycetota bacterium]
MINYNRARELLREFKGNSYLFGSEVLPQVGQRAVAAGNKAALIRGTFPGSDYYVEIIRNSLAQSGINLVAEIRGARPNCPREDLFRIAESVRETDADIIISFGGGSTIDAAKAAEVLRTLNGDINTYFGTGFVSETLKGGGKSLTPHIAIQTVAGSAAHLTKYSNITEISTGQKKLIVDDAIVPAHPVFDYKVTYSTPPALTADGALDGISHSLEVLYGATGKPEYEKLEEIAGICIKLVIKYLPIVIADPKDKEAREALCLATDLGGYSIMTGGTNGGHLTSFSLVDILPHGRACAIMNPYYTVFFAPAIERPLRVVGKIYQEAALTKRDIETLKGRELGIAVAEAMFELARRIGFPTCLSDVDGFGQHHIDRALAAAKNPQLKMKLQNMPVPLISEMIDDYMGPILEAARDGNLSLIKNVK